MSGSNTKKSIRRKRSELRAKRSKKRSAEKAPLVIPAMNYRGSDGKHMKVVFAGNPKSR